VFDELLRALIGFDLHSTVSFDMEWLMLYRPLFERISEGYSLGVIQHLTWYTRSSFPFLFILFSFVYICGFLLLLFLCEF